MNPVNITVLGADKLADQIDEIESLIHKLRLKLGDLNERGLRLEMQINQVSGAEKTPE
jgi:hypothetical protein